MKNTIDDFETPSLPRDLKEVLVSEIIQKEDIIPNGTVQEMAAEEEPMFLNLMLHSKDLLQDTMDARVIVSDHFFWEQNARLFSIITLNFFQQKGALLTRDYFETLLRGDENFVAGQEYFNRVESLRVSPEDYERLRKGLIDRNLQQRFYELTASHQDGVSGVAKILDATNGQGDLISKFIGKVVDLDGDRALAGESVKVTELDDALDKALVSIDDRRTNPDAHRGHFTDFKGIDEVTNGLYPGDYAVVVGYPNGGKTTFMYNLAMGLAKHGATVCYVTVESNEQVLAERMISKYSFVDSAIIKKGGAGPGQITPEIWDKIAKAKEEISELFGDRFTYITVPQKTPVNVVITLLEKKRRKIKSDPKRKDELHVAIVDYLDVIDPVDKNPAHRDLEIGDVSVRLQAYGRSHGIVMITAQSFNNEMIKAIKKMQLKESATADADMERVVGFEGVGGTQKLSRDADYVWGLILGQGDKKLCVYWMKSRHSAKKGHFALFAKLECCHLCDEPGLDRVDYDTVADPRNTEEKVEEVKMKNSDKVESGVAKDVGLPGSGPAFASEAYDGDPIE